MLDCFDSLLSSVGFAYVVVSSLYLRSEWSSSSPFQSTKSVWLWTESTCKRIKMWGFKMRWSMFIICLIATILILRWEIRFNIWQCPIRGDSKLKKGIDQHNHLCEFTENSEQLEIKTKYSESLQTSQKRSIAIAALLQLSELFFVIYGLWCLLLFRKIDQTFWLFIINKMRRAIRWLGGQN